MPTERSIEHASIFSDYFTYDETSTTFLRWKVQRHGGSPHNRILVRDVGDVAGFITVNGYVEVGLDNVRYKVHRVIYAMLIGDIAQDEDIDHIDGNRLNNRPSNLRTCNNKVNSQNRKKRYDNTSGFTGVTRYKDRKGNSKAYWLARWTDLAGKERAKAFRVDIFGEEVALGMAVEHRKSEILKLVDNGQHYTERHGK